MPSPTSKIVLFMKMALKVIWQSCMGKTCSKSTKEVIGVLLLAIVLKTFALNLFYKFNKLNKFSLQGKMFHIKDAQKLENCNAHIIEIADTDGHIGFGWWFHFSWWDVYFIILPV